MSKKEKVEEISEGELYIHLYKGEKELCLMREDQSFSTVDHGNNLLHKDFNNVPWQGFECHLHYWVANGCRWKHEVDSGKSKRALPKEICLARFNRKLKKMMCHKRIAMPQHLIDLYDTVKV